MEIATLGIGIGKTRFDVVGPHANGEPLIRKKERRPKLMQFVATCRSIGMERVSDSSIWPGGLLSFATPPISWHRAL